MSRAGIVMFVLEVAPTAVEVAAAIEHRQVLSGTIEAGSRFVLRPVPAAALVSRR